MHLNIEIKARCDDPITFRNLLKVYKADFRGTDFQTDTYFNVAYGRMKLREGNIENALIHYFREQSAGPKKSEVILTEISDTQRMKHLLSTALGIKIVVRKKREIYFIGNVKFHIDEVDELGSFVEIEAIDKDGSIGQARLQEQCGYYLECFGITASSLQTDSYSDMLWAETPD